MKRFLLLFIFFISLIQSFSQGFSKNEDEFVAQIQKIMKDSKNEKLIQVGEQFAYTYSDLNSAQKELVLNLSNQLKAKQQRAPIYGYYFGGIIAATDSGGGVSAEQLTSFLDVCDKTFKNEPKNFNKFIKSASRFFINYNLYKTKLQQYQLDGGTFMFEYAEEKVEEIIIPEPVEEEEKKPVEDPFGAWDDEGSSDDDDGWGDADDESWEEESWEDEEESTENTEDVETAEKMNFGAPEVIQPPITGPTIKITNANIIINTPEDSGITIENTTGSYLLLKNQFVGEGGAFDWSNGGKDMVDASVTLGKYDFKTEGKVFIQSEGAKLNYKEASDEEIEGAFQFRINKAKPAKYPRFISYSAQIELKNVPNGVKYYGGLSLEGAKQSSASYYGEPSTIIVSLGEEEKFRAKSNEFTFNDSLINSKKAYILMHVNEDTILHNGMSLKYNFDVKKLTYFKGPKTSQLGPFFDKEHNVQIQAEKLEWYLEGKEIDFSMIYAGHMKAAQVESMDFYTDGHFTRLKGLSRFHPLTVLMYYAKKKKTDVVYVSDLAKHSGQPDNTLRAAMVKLSREGFVNYSKGDGKITILRKAKLYMAARKKKADWDQLLIFSHARRKNITYDLESKDLIIRGVKDLMLSVPQNIQAFPDSGVIIMRGNRDLYFDGKVNSGQFQFTGHDYRFDYDSFFVDMKNIDSIRLKYNAVDTTSGEEEEAEHTLGNKLVYSSGVLYVDKQNNKSHKKNYPEYPIFDATTGAYVYFNEDAVLDHAYDTTVYFRIPPFVVDSLNDSDPNAVSFRGTFYGGKIIEPFNETLKIMDDYSFGFIHDVPDKGHKVYDGKGTVYNKVTLNKQGIRADGEIKYLSTTVKSNDFVFYLDSAITDSGSTAAMLKGDHKGVLYPQASVSNYSLNWKAFEDKMHISNNDSVIKMYDGKASLDGTLTATPTGTLGKGKAISGRAVAESQEMAFSQDDFKARNASFYVKPADEFDSLYTIKADSVFLEYNMVDQYADFGPEIEGYASVEFPYMQYKTSIGNGRWDMVENTVKMERNFEEDIYYSYFYSTHKDQDSLVFNADSAVCDLDNSKLEIFGVPYIYTGDSKIVPDSNKVYVLEDADIQEFENAMVYIDTLNEYHTLDSGRIDIISRGQYAGEARYQYVNAAEDTFYIDFNAFRMERYSQKKNDNRMFTMSGGYVMEEDSFFISPRIQYYGDVELDARENFLYFNGFVKIDLKGGFLSDWFKFDGRINPADVKIDLDDPKAADGTPLVTGLHVAEGDSAHLYSSFIALKEMETDFDIMIAKGIFGYNPYQNEFSITDERKEKEESYAGNVLVLNDSTSEIRYEGAFEFITNDPKKFEIHAAGNGGGNIKTGDYSFSTTLTTYYKVPGAINNIFAEVFSNASEGNPEPYIEDLTYRIADLAGDNPAQIYSENGGDYEPLFNISSKFNRSIVFSDLNLQWSDEFKSLYSPDSLSIGNLSKTDINAEVDGFVEFRWTWEGQTVNIYLQPDSSTWFYFNYANHTLSMLSSDLSFNALTYDKSNIEKRATPQDYAFGLADYTMKDGFIAHYMQNYQDVYVDSLDPEKATEMQAALLTEINGFINGGGSKKADEDFGEEEEDEDIFFDEEESDDELDDLSLDEEEDEDSNDESENFDSEDADDNDLDLDEDLAEDDEDPWAEANEKIEKKKKKKDKKKKDEETDEEEENSMFEDDESDDDLLDEPLFDEEEEEEKPKKEKKKKVKEEKPVEEEPLFEEEEVIEEEEDLDLDEDLSEDDEDPWAEANEKIEKKKKKKEKKNKSKDEEPEESLDSLDDELDDFDE